MGRQGQYQGHKPNRCVMNSRVPLPKKKRMSNQRRRFASAFTTVAVFLFWAIAVGYALPGQAQERDGFRPGEPFDPMAIFDRIFGADTEQAEQALRRVSVSPAEERAVGDRAASAYIRTLATHGIKCTQRGRDVAYLHDLANTIRPLMRQSDRYRRLQIYVADSPATDAKCFPGGTIIVFRGMLDFAGSEAALVGVIAHELSHLDHGHQLRTVKKIKLAQSSWSGGRPFDPRQFFQNSRLLLEGFMRPFRPEDETEADKDGARWSFQAGYDPREMADLFLRLHRRDGPNDNRLPEFLRSHPVPLDRYQTVMAECDRLRAAAPDRLVYVGVENLRRRVARSRKEFPER